MKIDKIIKSNCSDWDYEVESDEECEEDLTPEEIDKLHKQLIKEIQEEEWDADRNRDQS